MVDLAAILIAVAFVVLVAYLIPAILQVKRTIGQSERLLAQLNDELPIMLNDIKGTGENIRTMTDQARIGVDRAAVLLNAVGEVGQTVKHMHHMVRGRSGSILIGVTSLLAGIKAASNAVKQHIHREGGNTHGK